MLVARQMKLHAKWQEDGHIELKEFLTTKRIFYSQLEIFGDVLSQLLELAMIQLDTLTLDLLQQVSNYTTTTTFKILKED